MKCFVVFVGYFWVTRCPGFSVKVRVRVRYQMPGASGCSAAGHRVPGVGVGVRGIGVVSEIRIYWKNIGLGVCCNRGTYVCAVCMAVLRKEEVEDLHLGCG